MTSVDEVVDLSLTDAPDDDALQLIQAGVIDYNTQRSGPSGRRALAVLLTDRTSSVVIGGLSGRTAWRWLHIEWIFVPPALRGRGLASELLRRAEHEALRRGCIGAWLDTYNVEARRLYERLGFSVFGAIGDYPQGGARYFMTKPYVAGTSPDPSS